MLGRRFLRLGGVNAGRTLAVKAYLVLTSCVRLLQRSAAAT